MTIGPAPMIRMLFMSVRFGIAHQLGKAIEQISDVARSRTRLRVPLKAERRPIGPRETLEGTVEERNMRRPQSIGNRSRIDGETVVLASDHNLAGVEVLHRMVGAVVAELHLHRLRARGEAHQLVAQADAKY